jgi:translocator protein
MFDRKPILVAAPDRKLKAAKEAWTSEGNPNQVNAVIPFPAPAVRPAMALALSLLTCFLAAGTGLFVSTDGWYNSLAKPAWNPPAWVFAPAWAALYILMAAAAWLVWREGGWREQRRPLGLFLFQLLLNALWTPLFFGLHQPGWALAEIVLLWLTLAGTLFSFWRVSHLAGVLLMPYLAWVSFASLLNFAIWRLNR